MAEKQKTVRDGAHKHRDKLVKEAGVSQEQAQKMSGADLEFARQKKQK